MIIGHLHEIGTMFSVTYLKITGIGVHMSYGWHCHLDTNKSVNSTGYLWPADTDYIKFIKRKNNDDTRRSLVCKHCKG